MSKEHLLAIPVYNEERYLTRVIAESKRYSRHILVVDDGSTDRTPALLRGQRSVHVVTHSRNLGYGKSLADAFAYARCEGYAWLITMDCDEQHEPARIPQFVEAIAIGDADVISGTRYPRGFDAEGAAPADRRRINQHITALLNRRLGLKLTDAFCGFKAYRVSSLGSIEITEPGYAMPMQFWVQVVRGGLRVRELPVPLIYKDPTRHFGGTLDDPDARLRHYLQVLKREMAASPVGSRGVFGACAERGAPEGDAADADGKARAVGACCGQPRKLG
ncbi:MAG: glycosyltransferase family 2 protein [Phycisphaerae bacterium]|jgi:dolichol-phosphate mannosyltransferase